jgi:O-antigen ligase
MSNSLSPRLFGSLKRESLVNATGLFGTLLLAFFAWLWSDGAKIAFVLIVASLLASPGARSAIARDRLGKLLLVLAIYMLLRSLWAMQELPDTRGKQIEDFFKWLELYAFVGVAWWLQGDLRRVNACLVLTLAGILLGIVMYADWHSLMQFKAEKRTGFNLVPILFGLISGTALLGLVLFGPRIWQPQTRNGSVALRLALWLAAFLVVSYGLIATQSRGAWLAAALTLPPLAFIRYLAFFRANRLSLAKALAVMAAGGALVVGILAANEKAISSRLNAEQDVRASVMAGKLDHLPRTSLAFRVHAQVYGLKKWLERPVFGWGTGSSRYVIAQSGMRELRHPDENGRLVWLLHLHNSYLEILVRFGLVGLFLFAAGTYFIFDSLKTAYRSGRLPLDYLLFLAGGLVLFLVWSFFDFAALHYKLRFYWLLLGGMAYSFALNRESPQSPSGSYSEATRRECPG